MITVASSRRGADSYAVNVWGQNQFTQSKEETHLTINWPTCIFCEKETERTKLKTTNNTYMENNSLIVHQ